MGKGAIHMFDFGSFPYVKVLLTTSENESLNKW